MITVERITKLYQDWVTDDNIFLVEAKVNKGNKVLVFIDKIGGLNVIDCVSLSRFIESNIDREKEDFELNVSSPGADSPFLVQQQYIKNIGRTVSVTDVENKKQEGILKSLNDEGINLELILKKKTKIKESDLFIPFQKIKETRVVISFK